MEPAGPSSLLHTTLEGLIKYICELQDRCKVYISSYMAFNGSCFMLTWTVSKNQLLEVGLTQNHWETMALRTLTIIDLLHFIMLEDPHEKKYTEIAFG